MMSGTRPPRHTQYEVWITREASDAINVSARKHDVTRGEYLQDAIGDALDLTRDEEWDRLLPPPLHTNTRYRHYETPKAGYKGRWSMWVRIRCTVHNRVPMMLTAAATEEGHGSASALVRHHLALAIKADTGKTVPMPKSRTAASLFGGQINEVVL